MYKFIQKYKYPYQASDSGRKNTLENVKSCICLKVTQYSAKKNILCVKPYYVYSFNYFCSDILYLYIVSRGGK